MPEIPFDPTCLTGKVVGVFLALGLVAGSLTGAVLAVRPAAALVEHAAVGIAVQQETHDRMASTGSRKTQLGDAYAHGLAGYIETMHATYLSASPEQRATLRTAVLQRTAGAPLDHLPAADQADLAEMTR